MKIYIESEDRLLVYKFEGKVIDLLNMININPETVIVVRNDEIVPEEEMLSDKDEIKILSVISGG